MSDRLGSHSSSSDQFPTFRCQDGVILTGSDGFSDWGTGWIHRSRNRFVSTFPEVLPNHNMCFHHRRLVFCHFEVHFSHYCLLLHPILRPVDLLPLARCATATPGSPMKLLPFNTPAYYLGPYTGPTNALTVQFDDSLRGLGVGRWKDLFNKPTGKHPEGPSYVVAWVAVQNRRGEEKGISIVWPLSLCLVFLPESPQARQGLLSLPELPTPLRIHSSIPPPSSTTANMPLVSPQDPKPALSAIPTIPPVGLPPRVAIHSAHSLLSLPSRIENAVVGVSREVSGFVDYVAKERERERERIKRERDSHLNPIPSSQPTATHATVPEREQSVSSPPTASVTLGEYEVGEPPSAEPREPLDGLDTALEDPAQETPAAHEQSPDITGTYEIYPNFNPPWAQSADQFSTLEIDYQIDFGLEMNTMDRGAAVSGETGVTTDLDDIYGVFTDDDFNFFDRRNLGESYLDQTPSVSFFHDPLAPQHGAIPSVVASPSPTNGATMHPGQPAGLQHPTPPSPSLWTSTPQVDPLASNDLMESTSSPSISSQSTPSTPQAIPDLRGVSSTHGASIFDPVWFAPAQRISDHKYASGKFSFADPRAVQVTNSPQHDAGWKFRYNDATDPRRSVVRRLTGPPFSVKRIDAKRENLTGDDWGSLSEEDEDWSDVESSDGRSAGFADVTDICVIPDHPCTPPPQFTPLGPALLDCQFHHSHLLPLSRPLRSPSSALTATGLQGTVPTISVPTPVSPPAILGEKLRSWEAAAGLLVKEVVENSLWAESWQTNNHTLRTTSYASSTCQNDVSQLATVLGTLDDSHTSLEIGTLFDFGMVYSYCISFDIQPHPAAAGSLQPHLGNVSSSLQNMDPPFFSVGKGNSIVNVSPSAVRFWEKAHFHPVGGQKNVNAFVLYEGESAEMLDHASRWFKQVSIAYAVRLYFPRYTFSVFIQW